ncbi:hypothetical protein COLO4_14905 [Corchorus olitorius]|uniref:LRAT domain-containing protein n=1 Tax=Corchorus olitorius TaxID=93759 RepID=A0A1R3JQM7_9ROSI|nr:hypothetical protein COLO4_14905 [Corchorus olitorius]
MTEKTRVLKPIEKTRVLKPIEKTRVLEPINLVPKPRVLKSIEKTRVALEPGDEKPRVLEPIEKPMVALEPGIYVGDNKVIHFERPKGRFEGRRRCKTCGFNPQVVLRANPPVARVLKTCLDCFLAGCPLYRCEYDVSYLQLFCSTWDCKPPDEVVQTAHLLVNGKFEKYLSFQTNCDFAVYCKTGVETTPGYFANALDKKKRLLCKC